MLSSVFDFRFSFFKISTPSVNGNCFYCLGNFATRDTSGGMACHGVKWREGVKSILANLANPLP